MGLLLDQMVAARVGCLFPGQGAQYVGMGKEWVERFPRARQTYEEADRILSYSISRICFEGPEETLKRTLYAQPAIFVTSLAIFFVLEQKRPELRPEVVAGLSLGEFSSLVAAGSLKFTEGLRLVQSRAQLMELSAAQKPGAMASVSGLSQAECQSIAEESGAEVANLNAPDQFVLSGTGAAIQRAASLAEGMGAKRVIPLKVGGAFHSSLMKEARLELEQALSKVRFEKPKCLFIANVTAQVETEPLQISRLLGEQVTSPVRWMETMQRIAALGINQLVELGPGRVLKGLARRTTPTIEVLSLDKVEDLETNFG